MTRLKRSECATRILYVLSHRDSVQSKQKLYSLLEGEFPHSTFIAHLEELKSADFVKFTPVMPKKKVLKAVKLDMLGRLFVIFMHFKASERPEALGGWRLSDKRLNELTDGVAKDLRDFLQSGGDKVFGALISGDKLREWFASMTGELLTLPYFREALRELLWNLSKDLFDDYVTDDGILDLDKFENELPKDKLYNLIAESTIQPSTTLTLGHMTTEGLQSHVSGYKKALESMPEADSVQAILSFKAYYQQLVSRSLQDMSKEVVKGYDSLLSKAKPDQLVQPFGCPKCGFQGASLQSISEMLDGNVTCPSCKAKIPMTQLPAIFSQPLGRTFEKWLRKEALPSVAWGPLVAKDLPEITCELNVRGREDEFVAIGDGVHVNGRISPPHPRTKATLVFENPKGKRERFEAQTGEDGGFEFRFVPNAQGYWNVYAEWMGDEDHYRAVSKKKTFLVKSL